MVHFSEVLPLSHIIKMKPLHVFGYWDLLWSLKDYPKTWPLASSKGAARKKYGLVLYLRSFALPEAFFFSSFCWNRKSMKEGTVPTVLWFCYLLMHSSPLGAVTCWWKGEERGWGIFAECREYLDASIFPGYLELLEQNELAKNHYILNYIWILDGAISPSCRYKLGEALSLRTLRIHSTLSMRTASSFYLTSAKDVTRLAWE